MIDASAKGLAETKRKVEQVIADVHGEPVLQAFRSATVRMANTAKTLAPVDRGQLRSSIVSEVRLSRDGKTVEGVVGSNKKYAAYQELGTGTFAGKPRHFPPPSALETWARRHGFPNGYVVALAIYRAGGIRPKRFLQRAFEQHREGAVDEIARAVKLIVDK